jgi:hypothetical protein
MPVMMRMPGDGCEGHKEITIAEPVIQVPDPQTADARPAQFAEQ